MKIHTTIEGKQKKSNSVEVRLVEGNETYVRESEGVKVLIVGIGKRDEINARKLTLLARRVVSLAKSHSFPVVGITFSEWVFPKAEVSSAELAELLAVNFEMANFSFVKYKTDKNAHVFVDSIEISVSARENIKALKEGLLRGQIIGKEVNASRVLSNTPGGEMTPKLLAEAAKEAYRGTKVKLSVLDEKKLKQLGMGGVLGVAGGSENRPRFLVAEYMQGKKGEKPVVLVGKGVTFDTGGINLKPSDSILDMYLDMSGGAAVIHALAATAKLGVKKNIVVLVPAVENMPSGTSYRPGDVLKSMSGQTIEVRNTDAEGRIILADALTYAEKYTPKLVVDVATLTGAAMVALGLRASALYTKDDDIAKHILDVGEASGDYIWRMPLWEEFENEVKGEFGDWANLSVKYPKYGGSITAATFLYQFAKKYPWAHIDMAPRMVAADDEYLSKGSAGAPVRLLVKMLEIY